MRLIDADAIPWQYGKDGDVVIFPDTIAKIPTIEPEPKRGRWIYDHGDYKCSVCGHTINDPYYVENYCTRCGSFNGAKMEEK